MSSGYIYLLQPLQSITNKEEIYKIGKTKRNNFKRFNEYPSGSILLLQSSCKNCDLMERRLLKIFDEKYIKETDYGREYFRGDLFEMKKVINSEIMNEEVVIDVDNNENLSSNTLIELSTVNGKESYNYSEKFICHCGKKYKYRQGLFSHRKQCINENDNNTPLLRSSPNKVLNTNIIMELINQNKEFKDLLLEQYENSQLVQQQTEEHQNQFLDLQKENNTLMNKLVEITQTRNKIIK